MAASKATHRRCCAWAASSRTPRLRANVPVREIAENRGDPHSTPIKEFHPQIRVHPQARGIAVLDAVWSGRPPTVAACEPNGLPTGWNAGSPPNRGADEIPTSPRTSDTSLSRWLPEATSRRPADGSRPCGPTRAGRVSIGLGIVGAVAVLVTVFTLMRDDAPAVVSAKLPPVQMVSIVGAAVGVAGGAAARGRSSSAWWDWCTSPAW